MNNNTRENSRIFTNMKLRSASLPYYSADVLDISVTGARLKLKGRAHGNIVDERIRFGIMLHNQIGTQFEGFARVAWVRETENGLEAGLQWERLTASEWEKAKGAFLLSQAA